MGGLSFWHILLLALVVLVLFGGRGRFSDIMGDFAKGLKNFKKGLADEEPARPAAPQPTQVLPKEDVVVPPPESERDKAAH
jgi:sec-independent protein translocase protein TatA